VGAFTPFLLKYPLDLYAKNVKHQFSSLICQKINNISRHLPEKLRDHSDKIDHLQERIGFFS
jgi:hypothetical protein